METPVRAAWIGATDEQLPAIRAAFDAQLAAALRAAFPQATLDTTGRQWDITDGGRAARLWEPNAFWGDEPEPERIARALTAVREQLEDSMQQYNVARASWSS